MDNQDNNQVADPIAELSAIADLIESDPIAAIDAYETWVWATEGRVLDVGGTAHLRFTKRRYRRRKGRR